MASVQDGMNEVYGFIGAAQSYNSALGSKLTSQMARLNGFSENANSKTQAKLAKLNKALGWVSDATKKTDNVMDYLLNLLSYTGPMDEIISWIANVLVYVLPEIEIAVKALLLSNIKSTLACNSDPRIPAKYRKNYAYGNNYGININLSEIDLYNMLDVSPFTDEGKNVYFGVQYNSVQKRETWTDSKGKTHKGKRYSSITARDIYELSRADDMNAFIWFVKHKAHFPSTIVVNGGDSIKTSLGMSESDNLLAQSDYSVSGSRSHRFLPGNTFRQNGGETTVALCLSRTVDGGTDNYKIAPATDDQNSANWYADSSNNLGFNLMSGSNGRLASMGFSATAKVKERNYIKEKPIFNLEYRGDGSTATYRVPLATNNLIFSILPKPFILNGAYITESEGNAITAPDILITHGASAFTKYVKTESTQFWNNLTKNFRLSAFLPHKILFNENGVQDSKGHYSINQDVFSISTVADAKSGFLVYNIKSNNSNDVAHLLYNLHTDEYALYEEDNTTPLSSTKATEFISECYAGLTVYEFNYDYVMSFKLFDPRVVAANLLNLALNVNIHMPWEHKNTNQTIKEAEVNNMVQKIMDQTTEDEEVNDCFYTFSNDEYDELLKEAALKRLNGKGFADNNGIVYSDIKGVYDILDEYNPHATLNEQSSIISSAITKAVDAACNANATNIIDGGNSLSSVSSKESDANAKRENIILQMIKFLSNTVVNAFLSPKVLMLIQINKKIMMGDPFTFPPKDNFPTSADVLKGMQSLLNSVVKELLGMVQKELLNLVIGRIEKLIKAYIKEMSEEYIQGWRDLIKQLLNFCSFSLFWKHSKNSNNGSETSAYIDDVDYADIMTTIDQLKPNTNNC
jgi:hypothetical protein